MKVRVLDVHEPPAPRRVTGVEYVAINLISDDVTRRLIGVDAVIHTAGVVGLRASQADHLYNIHVVATRNLIRSARLAGVRILVVTSSGGAVTSPYADTPQLRVPCDFTPGDDFPFASAYSSTKFAAEAIALRANEPHFAVVALRLPGLYGVGDHILADALIGGALTHVPVRPDGQSPTIDFCYVENAAHAHCVALDALIHRPADVAGRTFNVTDGEEETCRVVESWNRLLAACALPGTRPRVLRPLPYAVAYFAACCTELVDWYCAGRVPFPRAAVWGLTRASLGFATTSITLQLSSDLGYTPLYTAAQAFADIAEEWRARQARGAVAAADDDDAEAANSAAAASATVDWALPPLSEGTVARALDKLSGPKPSPWETALSVGGLLLGVGLALSHTLPSWGLAQRVVAIAFGVIDGAAAVQCSTAQSKRWYHAGGRMPRQLVLIIVAETVAQCALVGLLYAEASPLLYSVATSAWFTFCIGVLTTAVPLHVQRPASIWLFMCSAILLSERAALLPRTPGAEWIPMVLALKYLVSHLPRAEPYAVAAPPVLKLNMLHDARGRQNT